MQEVVPCARMEEAWLGIPDCLVRRVQRSLVTNFIIIIFHTSCGSDCQQFQARGGQNGVLMS